MADRGFLTRWSQRKAAATAEAQTPVAEAVQAVPEDTMPATPLSADSSAEAAPVEPEAELPPDLPDVESLTAESDFTAFMDKGVPEELRKLALRKLWRSNPVLANLDGLNEYDEDYSVIVPLAEGVAEEMHKMLFGDKDKDAEQGAEQDSEAASADDIADNAVADPQDADPLATAEEKTSQPEVDSLSSAETQEITLSGENVAEAKSVNSDYQ